MSYEPKHWEKGDTPTVADLNRIENGISDASSSGGDFAVVYMPNTSVGWQVSGLDFSTAHEKVTNGEPLIVFLLSYMRTTAQGDLGFFQSISFDSTTIYLYFYTSSYPRLEWTESGVNYVD